MSSKKPVVVYGASGYTGRLVCEYLREYNIPFVAAGRNAERVQAAMNQVPGIETATYDCVGVDHTVEALTDLFTGAAPPATTTTAGTAPPGTEPPPGTAPDQTEPHGEVGGSGS